MHTFEMALLAPAEELKKLHAFVNLHSCVEPCIHTPIKLSPN